ncbi:MAG: VOC family protein [Flavobacteriales bacterium]|nr:VOC family protein [Flavobacteriales bacterium]
MISTDIKSKLYIDHIVLTVSNIERTKSFYSKILGDPDHQGENSIMYHVGGTKLFLVLPYGTLPKDDMFDANRIGLEHLAIGVRTLNDLKEIETTLDKNSIKNSGIHIDKHSDKEKIWLDDSDGIRLEFFIRS